MLDVRASLLDVLVWRTPAARRPHRLCFLRACWPAAPAMPPQRATPLPARAIRAAWCGQSRELFGICSWQVAGNASFHEIGWEGRLEIQSFSGARVDEAQPPGMQHLSREARAPAIDLVPEHWMTEVLEVHADLVRAPRV